MSEVGFSDSVNWKEAARTFAAKGRVQIRNILDKDTVAGLEACFDDPSIWHLTFNTGKRLNIIRPEELSAKGRRWRADLSNSTFQGARDGFQFIYATYPILGKYLADMDSELILHRFLEFLNSGSCLDKIREITKLDDVCKADAQATWFQPFHFLTDHDDGLEAMDRRVAFVFNFSKNWRPEWGGLLEFLTDEKDVEETILPRFNSLSMFRVPAAHHVSMVTPIAKTRRVAITGWFRGGQDDRQFPDNLRDFPDTVGGS